MASQLRGTVVGLLRGFSGSSIDIVRDEGITFVRKFVKDKQRLAAEIMKMHRLQSLSGPLFDAPTIWTEAEGYYELEYIRGVTLEERLQTCSMVEVEEWAVRCADIVLQLRCQPGTVSQDEFDCLSFYLHLRACQYPFLKEVLAFAELLNTSSSFSHGDLTLDNILVTPDDELFLVDPSSHKFDTFQWDVAKLLQSCYTDWWEIRGAPVDRSRRLRLFCKLLVSQFLPGVDLRTSAFYLAVALLRIVPYARSASQKSTLLSKAFVMLDQCLGRRNLFSMEESRWT